MIMHALLTTLTPLVAVSLERYAGIAIAVGAILLVFLLSRIGRFVKRSRENKVQAEIAEKFETYTVAEGDTLWSIAEKFYGDGNKLTQLKQLNDPSMDSVAPGQLIKIREL